MYIRSCGMVTPVGLSFAASTAAMRARIAGFAEVDYRDRRGRPVVGAPVPVLPDGWLGRDRLLRLLAPAVAECLGERGLENAPRVALFLCLSHPETPGRPADLDRWLPEALQAELGVTFDPRSAVIAEGRTGAIRALRMAYALMTTEAVPACVVAGTDTLINAAMLAALDGARRLKAEDNPDGIIPGEAAAAVLVSRTAPADAAWPVVAIRSLGFGREEVLAGSDDPVLGIGLARATGRALEGAGIAMLDVDLRISDMTGERYGFVDANYALGRVLRGRKEFLELWHGMDAIGDTGAAAGPCMLARAAAAFAKGYAPGPVVLCESSAETGERAAAVLRHEPGQEA